MLLQQRTQIPSSRKSSHGSSNSIIPCYAGSRDRRHDASLFSVRLILGVEHGIDAEDVRHSPVGICERPEVDYDRGVRWWHESTEPVEGTLSFSNCGASLPDSEPGRVSCGAK